MITIELPVPFASQPELSLSGLTRFLNRVRTSLGLSGEVEVLLADDRVLRRLNKGFRGKDKSTDVLSFPAPAEMSSLHAGDLAISLETAARQAADFRHSLRDEVRILLLHGLLHLSGMDHETDQGEMAAREAALRRELRLSNTLIERTSTPRSTASTQTTKKLSAHKTSKTPFRTKAALPAAGTNTLRSSARKSARSAKNPKKSTGRGTG
jgi:probable rRNA maturation factor